MDRTQIRELLEGTGARDYEIYLNTQRLFTCQKRPEELCNPDELQFQIVHQMQELSMKLMAHTLLDVDELMEAGRTHRALTYFKRVHLLLRGMIDQLGLLETMSPRDYQEIRVNLGQGSGQESPGFRTLLKMYPHLWKTFVTRYLGGDEKALERIYDSHYDHGEAYAVAEALAEYDGLFQKFRFHHIQLIHRTIGLGARSLKGRSVELLNEGLRMQFFPPLWEIRNQMTNRWGSSYGSTRPAMPKPPSPRRRKDDR